MTPPRPTRRLLTGATLAALLLTSVPAAGAAAVAAVPGAQTSGDVLFPNVGNGGYDVAHYDIDLAWTPAPVLADSTIEATTTISAATTGAPLSSFSLDFEGLSVDSVTVDGAPAGFERVVDADAIKYKLVVTPAAPVDGTFTTVVAYSGVPSSHTDADGSSEGWNATDDGATFLAQPIGAMTAFPHNNTPSDKATYDIGLDVPSDLEAVSNGELAARTPNPDGTRTTWEWTQEQPMASELTIISIGQYRAYESTITLASGRRLREWSYLDAASTPTNVTTTLASRARMTEVLDFLEGAFGPYPGTSVGFVVDRVPSGINYALETQDRSFFPSRMSFGTMVHELTHQWYGNAVAPPVWNDIWINEGMATWMPTYFSQVVDGGAATESRWFSSWNATPADDADWTIPPAGMTDSADLYGYQTYTRSAQMWEALRLTIGDPAFFAFIEEWQARYGGTSAGREQFTALAEELSGQDLQGFFRDWLLDADKPGWPLSPAATPTVTGRAAVGRTLAADTSGWAAGTTFGYRWRRDGAAIPGADERLYQLRPVDLGRRITVVVTGRAAGFTAVSRTSRPTAAVARGVQVRRPRPAVVGRPLVGRTLRARAGRHDPGVVVRYRWYAGGRAVPGATRATLRVRGGLLGTRLRVQTRATRPGYAPVVRLSPRTDRVRRR